jgi:hypothetical protein
MGSIRFLPPFAKGGAAGGGINILELQIELQYDIDYRLPAREPVSKGVQWPKFIC